MTPSEKYTAAAYLVVFVGVLAYVLIIASKLQRLEREVGELVERARERRPRPMVELLFWPALLGYGEAALAYTSPRYTRLGTWGVRIGWLAQTALLAVQAARADGFPWSSWAGSLNLFVWLVVGAYLIWGCRPRYRLLGLAVMPLAAVLFLAAAARRRHRRPASARTTANLFLDAPRRASCSRRSPASRSRRRSPALYLLEERRLQRRSADILRLKLPSLVVLERLTLRTIAISLPLLTVGLAPGSSACASEGGSVDALMAATIVAWLVYGGLRRAAPDRPPRRATSRWSASRS